jgi:hypothetical protein
LIQKVLEGQTRAHDDHKLIFPYKIKNACQKYRLVGIIFLAHFLLLEETKEYAYELKIFLAHFLLLEETKEYAYELKRKTIVPLLGSMDYPHIQMPLHPVQLNCCCTNRRELPNFLNV